VPLPRQIQEEQADPQLIRILTMRYNLILVRLSRIIQHYLTQDSL
jgi:hypothetical protein